LACCGTLALLAAASAARAGLSYTLTDLRSVPGGSGTDPYGINNLGQIVGVDSVAGQSVAFEYSAGSIQTLNLPGSGSEASGINDSGQILGGDAQGAFLYTNGTTQTIPLSATGINNAGQIAGDARTIGMAGQDHAFLYQGGSLTDLGTLGGLVSNAFAINNAGQVVGSAQLPNSDFHAFLYTGGAMQDLGTLGGASSEALAINNLGQIVGGANLPGSSVDEAFLYSNGKMTDLGGFGGGESEAQGINDAGEIVGTAFPPGLSERAFLYVDGSMYDLNSLVTNGAGYDLESIRAFNDAGDIIATSSTSDGQYAAVLLTPTASQLTPSAVPLPRAAWAALTALPLSLLSRRVRRAVALG
jgi:probable HAF family extracellular repeat protein